MCAWVGQSQDGEAPDESQEVHENAFLEVADLEAQYTGLADQESEVDDSKEELEVQGILPLMWRTLRNRLRRRSW